MDIHKPHAPHSLGEFAREIATIVTGILIALALEQAVTWVHERNVAAETRAAVGEEVAENLQNLALRGQAEPCIARRLGEIGALLADWNRTGRFATPKWIAQVPGFDTATTRYDAALAAGRIAQLPREEQYALGGLMGSMRRFDQYQEEENIVWGRLRIMQAGPDALSAGDRVTVRQALQDARRLDYLQRLWVEQVPRSALEYGYRADPRRFQRTVSKVWRSGRFTPTICAAIDTPAPEANRQTGQIVPLPD